MTKYVQQFEDYFILTSVQEDLVPSQDFGDIISAADYTRLFNSTGSREYFFSHKSNALRLKITGDANKILGKFVTSSRKDKRHG